MAGEGPQHDPWDCATGGRGRYFGIWLVPIWAFVSKSVENDEPIWSHLWVFQAGAINRGNLWLPSQLLRNRLLNCSPDWRQLKSSQLVRAERMPLVRRYTCGWKMFKGVVSLCLWHFVYLPKNNFFLLDISCQWFFLDIVNVFQNICLQTLESITLSWKHMETYGNIWKTYGNMWKHMETYRSMWKHMETYGNMWKHMETYGSTWKHTETYGNMWKHMETYGSMWKHMETYGNMWKHMETYGSTWKHTETYGNYQSVTFPRRFNFTTARGASGWTRLTMAGNSRHVMGTLVVQHWIASYIQLPYQKVLHISQWI